MESSRSSARTFESGVISLGNETRSSASKSRSLFESGVISLGNETLNLAFAARELFESGVISLGNETDVWPVPDSRRLRVVSFRWGTKPQQDSERDYGGLRVVSFRWGTKLGIVANAANRV